MKSLLEMFVTECEYKNLSPLTVKTYKTDIGYLNDFLEGIMGNTERCLLATRGRSQHEGRSADSFPLLLFNKVHGRWKESDEI